MSELPDKLGPYRLLERLGAGGMGEVFLAYDERLDRRVAIKRIRPGAIAVSDRRERFRREARTAARLNHPAIVQVYDVLSDGDTDAIVMEYVLGTNLRRLLHEEGPLPVARALGLAREVARGLAEAHGQGIVHRDLKAENVLVTPAGRAKIADFGIAKRSWVGGAAEAGSGELPEEETLTQGGLVLGTYRTMSPEQARGEPVDHRSDLFSLGVLLYETLAGRSPFEADNELATLQRIVHHRQPPLAEVVPAVPAELSQLVDHLLQKDPLLRPRSATEVAVSLDELAGATAGTGIDRTADSATLVGGLSARFSPAAGPWAPPAASAAPLVTAETVLIPSASLEPARGPSRGRRFAWLAAAGALVLAAAGTGAYFLLRPPPAPLYVAVLAPELPGGQRDQPAEIDLLASGVRVALLRGLLSLEAVSPKSFDEIDALDAITAAAGGPTAVARAVSADEVVTSRLDCRRESCRVAVSRLLGSDGHVLWAESVEVPTDDFYLVASAVASEVRRAYPDHRVRPGSPPLAVDGADLKRFLELRRRFDAKSDPGLASVLAGLEEIRRRAPRFLDAHLLEADVLRYRFFDSRDPEDLKRAREVVDQAREIADDDPQPLFRLFDVALDGGDLAEAERALAGLARLAPGDVGIEERRARLLRARGDLPRALAVMRSAAARNPSSKRLTSLARMEYQQGDIAAARTHLEQSLARAPGNYGALSYLAQIEMTSGDAERAVVLYRQLVRRAAGRTEISNLGLAYFLLGRYPQAAESFRRAREAEPRNPFYTLNLADAYLLMGRAGEARALYGEVVERIAADPHASGPQFLTVKAQALAHLGRGREAVAAVQEALRLAPDDGPTAFEAAVVYAVLGERSSATFAAEAALQRGYEPRWFRLPWFDAIRDQPELAALLARPRR